MGRILGRGKLSVSDLRERLDSLPDYLVDAEEEFDRLDKVVDLFRKWRLAGDEELKNSFRDHATDIMRDLSREHTLFLYLDED